MAKIRVHELAKEMGLNSRELLQKILDLDIQVKNHFSTLEEAEVARIKGNASMPKKPAVATERASQSNSKENKTSELRKNSSNRDTRQSGNLDVPVTAEKDSIEDKPKAGAKSKTEALNKSDAEYSSPKTVASEDRPVNRAQGDRPVNRVQGDRPINRVQGDRPPGNRVQGDRPPGSRPPGDRPINRVQGDRPPGSRPPGDRPPGNRVQGDRPPGNRPPGSRPPGDRPPGNRVQGDRPPGNRPPGSRPPGDRPASGGFASPTAGGKPAGKSDRDKPRTTGDAYPARNQPKGVPPKKNEVKRTPLKPNVGRDKVNANRINEEDAFNARNRKKPGRGGNRGQNKGKGVQRVVTSSLPKVVTIGENVTIQDLAGALNRTAAEIIKRLMNLGVMATATQTIDFDTAALVCSELGVDAQSEITQEEALLPDVVDDPALQVGRPPVVTVMGHVDHGKTSLLDAIRSTKVTEGEAGGITQHIGAYQIKINERKITFIDTPGHEAFTAMRARGAQVTDIAILVVAADDGVMPQTIEAISHAKAAEVPIIVAVNKIDKPTANQERIKQQLMEHGLVAEEFGGDTIFVPVSAHTREGLDTLLEMILLVAEIHDFKANPDRNAKGTVIEAQLDKGRGPVATVLVQHGTLNIGDSILVGLTYGKVRAMVDHLGNLQPIATPSTPVELIGLDGVPMAGDTFQVVDEERIARQITATRQDQRREEEMHKATRVTLDDLFKQIKEGQIKELNIIIKGDVQGSIEALRQSLDKLGTEEVRVNFVHTGVGTINESDVMLASASNAIIIGFNVRPDHNTRKAAELEQVDIRLYRVIYEAVEDVRAAMSGLLDPDWKEIVLGRAEVRATFKVPKVGMIAGSYVLDGKILRGAEVRVIRNGIVIQEGKLDSLRRFKDDVKEVVQGYECGIGIENFNDVKEGDIIEAYQMERVERSL